MDDHAGAPLPAVLHGEYRCTAVYGCTAAIQAIYGYTGYIRLYRLYGPAGRALPEEWSELDLPISRARARARVTMRTRIMRARVRARARARGDKPLRCSRIINGVEDYRFAVLGSSKDQASQAVSFEGSAWLQRSQAVSFEGSAWPAWPGMPWIWPNRSNPLPGLTRV